MITTPNAYDLTGRKWSKKRAGTVIIPQQKHFQVQGILMQNMTEQDLKLEFTFKMKPTEIAISKA